jgi:hypothetical protein
MRRPIEPSRLPADAGRRLRLRGWLDGYVGN